MHVWKLPEEGNGGAAYPKAVSKHWDVAVWYPHCLVDRPVSSPTGNEPLSRMAQVWVSPDEIATAILPFPKSLVGVN